MINKNTFLKMKKKTDKIVMMTAYDYPSAMQVEAAGVDVILVGDTVGMVVMGMEDTLEVTLNDIIYHCKAVRRGAPQTFVIADMPFMTYHINSEETKRNASRLIIEGKANAVKLEGGTPERIAAIRDIISCEIPVVAHLGLTPQSIHQMGGYKVQGKDSESYDRLIDQAKEVENAGAFMLVLEAIPEKLGKAITEEVGIPTIGIGAGRFTDGQVLVYHDMLGLSTVQPKFVKGYGKYGQQIVESIKDYKQDVKDKKYPEIDHVYYPET